MRLLFKSVPENIRITFVLTIFAPFGELAQLVERLHGMQEVTGSNPVFSTKANTMYWLFTFLSFKILAPDKTFN